MHSVDRGQYELLLDDEIPYNSEDIGQLPLVPLRLDSTHNLDLFFSQIYEYHQLGGFTVIAINCFLSALKFVFLFFCLMELTACVEWNKVLNPEITINTWDDVVLSPGVCWASLPPFATVCLLLAILVFVYHLIHSGIALAQMWGVRRFCIIALDIPSSESELNDLTWGEVLRRLLAVQTQMPICRTKVLDELDVYNRILRQTNYLIGMVNREVIPFRFRVPFFPNAYVYLPHYYLLNLKIILFLGSKCPFVSYSQLRPEYKLFTKRLELADELSKYSRIIGFIGFLLSPLVFLIQLLFFLFSNAQRLRYQPSQLFYRSWSNYARLYLRHFNELPHEFDTRLNQAYKPATEYLECFQSRLLSVTASHLAFTLGGLSILLFVVSLCREGLIHLPGFLAAMAVGGLIARICVNFIPTEDAVHFPRASLLATLAKIHYMPDSWKDSPHAHNVRYEFSQLFQFRAVGAVEEILSPILVPLIMLFYVPRKSLDIVDFFRNFTVELDGVGDVCSFAQLDILRHGDPEWYPVDGTTPSSPSSGDGGYDDSNGVRTLPAAGGKTELSLMHFHHTNPSWCLPPDRKAFLSAVRKQALNDLQRHQQVQANFIRGLNAPTSLFTSLYCAQEPKNTATISARQKSDVVYSFDFSIHAKNLSHMPAAIGQPSFGVTGALVESVKCQSQTSNTEAGTPAEISSPPLPHQTERQSASKSASLLVTPVSIPPPGITPSASLMAASSLCYNQQIFYQPYMSLMEDKTAMNTSYISPTVAGSMSYGELTADMDISSLYIHDLHQRRRNALRLSQVSALLPSTGLTLRQYSFTSDGFQEELRYQQPGHRYLGLAGRGRGLVSGTSVPASLRSTRQFEGVVEEEADAEEENVAAASIPQQQQLQATSASSSTVTATVSPHILGDDVQKWPDLPPPTC